MPEPQQSLLARCLSVFSQGENPADRRRATRFKGNSVRCTLGELIDISATGARIRCRRFYRPFEGRPVTIQIEKPDASGLITLYGCVCWTTHDSGRWYAGVAFDMISKETAVALGETLKALSGQPLNEAA